MKVSGESVRTGVRRGRGWRSTHLAAAVRWGEWELKDEQINEASEWCR